MRRIFTEDAVFSGGHILSPKEVWQRLGLVVDENAILLRVAHPEEVH